MIRYLGNLIRSGKNYASVAAWLHRMAGTTIEARGGGFFLARTQSYAEGSFRVFERIVAAGDPRADGRPADRNYVWLPEWYLDNMEAGYFVTLPVAAYRRLKRGISKALALALPAHGGPDPRRAEMGYEELCRLMNLAPYRFPSKVEEKLAPALEELRKAGFVEKWRLRWKNGSATLDVTLPAKAPRGAPAPAAAGA